MTTADERISRLEARLEALEEENHRLMARDGGSDPVDAPSEPVSRRALLGKLGAVAAAGAGASLLRSQPAAAANGQNLVWGTANNGTTTILFLDQNTDPEAASLLVSRVAANPGDAVKGTVGDSGISETGVVAGVKGEGNSHHGVVGLSNTGIAVFGTSNNTAVFGRSTNDHAIEGRAGSGAPMTTPEKAGVRGDGTNKFGVIGTSTLRVGVYGESTNDNAMFGQRGGPSGVDPGQFAGVRGDATNGAAGVIGTSLNNEGVVGISSSSTGVSGKSNGGAGVVGTYTGGTSGQGVLGLASGVGSGAAAISGLITGTAPGLDNFGVAGHTNATNGNGAGVRGTHDGTGPGVLGRSVTGSGVVGRTPGTANGVRGVHGIAEATAGTAETFGVVGENASTNSQGGGVLGTHAGSGPGVLGRTAGNIANGVGVQGVALSTAGAVETFGVAGRTNSTNSSGAGVLGFHAGTGTGVLGRSTGGPAVTGEGTAGPGVLGLSTTNIGVRGQSQATGNTGFGVVGIHPDSGVGMQGEVLAQTPTTTSYAVKGINRSRTASGIATLGSHDGVGIGVLGEVTALGTLKTGGTGVAGNSAGIGGAGVEGKAFLGTDVALVGSGRLFLKPAADNALPPAPSATAYVAGDVLRNIRGDIFVCIAPGSPGDWRKVTAGALGYHDASGSNNFLAKPIRIFDTRPGEPAPLPTPKGILAPNSDTVIQVTGTVVDGLSVPTNAKALIGNLTVTGQTGGGFLRMFPTGTTPLPLVSVINYEAGVNLANGVTMALNTSGQVTIHCDISATHAILDITGFVF